MILEVRNLGHRFEEGRWGLKDISFRIDSPAFILAAGPNGSGKTLLARHLVGLAKATEGSVLVDETDLYAKISENRKRIALVFQEPEHQILGMTVGEDIAFSPKQWRWSKEETAKATEHVLRAVGLAGRENELAAFLSGGEKRRLAIASALIAEPEILILDEPFNDLDWEGVRDLLRILLELRRRGTTIFLITHDIEKCLAHAERLMVFRAGALIADDKPEELWPDFANLGLRKSPNPVAGWKGQSWLV